MTDLPNNPNLSSHMKYVDRPVPAPAAPLPAPKVIAAAALAEVRADAKNFKAEFLAAAAKGEKSLDEVRAFIIDHESFEVEAETSIENLIARAKKYA